jgi:hypothetical protein
VAAVNSGPLGANAVSATLTLPTRHSVPFNPLKDVAFHALSSAYVTGYLISGILGLGAALLAFFGSAVTIPMPRTAAVHARPQKRRCAGSTPRKCQLRMMSQGNVLVRASLR